MATVPATSITSSPSNSQQLTRLLFWILLGVICLASALLPGSPLLGEWESQTVYAVFGTQANQLALSIAPAANIGGQGYIFLDVSRNLIEIFQLPYTLDLIRLPTKVIGAAGLVVFSLLARRWFGPWSALAATVLLAVNPVYHQYQNELIIAGPSLVVFILLVERLQYVSRKPTSWAAWITLMLVWALLLTMYGPSRIYGTALIAAWLAYSVFRTIQNKSGTSLRGLTARAATTGALVPVTLLLAEPSNAQFFNRTLLFPRVTESTLVNGPFSDALAVIPLNAQILAESVLLGGGEHHSTFLQATLIQGRFPTIPLLIVPLMLAGLGFVAWQAWLARREAVNKYLVIVGLAGLTTLPLLTSSVFDGENGPTSSLVNHRLAFFLLPAYLAIAALGSFIATRTRGWKISSALIAFVLISAGVSQILVGHANFLSRTAAADLGLTGKPGQAQWLSGYALSGKGVSQGSHFQQHQQYRHWAAATAEAVITAETQPEEDVLFVTTSVDCFPEAPFVPDTVKELQDKNYHGTFLSTYLGHALRGESVGYVNVPSSQDPLGWVMYKSGVFSGPLETGSDGHIDYSSPDETSARIMAFGAEPPRLILTTTPTEFRIAADIFVQQERAFSVLDSPLPCWSGD